MIIKVDGVDFSQSGVEILREADLLGLDFIPESPCCIGSRQSLAGIVPDRPVVAELISSFGADEEKSLVGLFRDEMMQTVVAGIYNYHLPWVQLQGSETSVYVDNLKSTVVPDIRQDLKVMRPVQITGRADIERLNAADVPADMLLLSLPMCDGQMAPGWQSVLDGYLGDMPFLLCASANVTDLRELIAYEHPCMRGVDIAEGRDLSAVARAIDLIRGGKTLP